MKYYIVVYDRVKNLIKAETMIYANEFMPIGLDFVINRQTIASFRKWDYWIEITEDQYEEIETDIQLDEQFRNRH